MNQAERKKKARKIINEVLDFLYWEQMVDSSFFNDFVVEFANSGGSWGGIKRETPIIKIGLCDRYFDNKNDNKKQLEIGRLKKHIARRSRYAAKFDLYSYSEYPSFDNSLDIGGFVTEDPDLLVYALVCHEIAHAVAYYNYFQNRHFAERPKPHGNLWKSIYRTLRDEFVTEQLNEEIFDRANKKAAKI